MRVCEIATLRVLSVGIDGRILQNCQTWLQCRQQVDPVCQVVEEKIDDPKAACDEEKGRPEEEGGEEEGGAEAQGRQEDVEEKARQEALGAGGNTSVAYLLRTKTGDPAGSPVLLLAGRSVACVCDRPASATVYPARCDLAAVFDGFAG